MDVCVCVHIYIYLHMYVYVFLCVCGGRGSLDIRSVIVMGGEGVGSLHALLRSRRADLISKAGSFLISYPMHI